MFGSSGLRVFEKGREKGWKGTGRGRQEVAMGSEGEKEQMGVKLEVKG